MRENLEATCGREQLLAGDVRVAADRGEVGMAEVLGDQARVSECLAERLLAATTKVTPGDRAERFHGDRRLARHGLA